MIHGRIRGRKAGRLPTGCNIYGEERPRGPLQSLLQRGAFSPLPSSSFARSYFKVMPRRSCIETSAIAVEAGPLIARFYNRPDGLGSSHEELARGGGRGKGRVIIYTEKVYARAPRYNGNEERSKKHYLLEARPGRVGNLSSLATRFRNQSLNKNQANLPPHGRVSYPYRVRSCSKRYHDFRGRNGKNGLSSSKMIEEATLTRIGGALAPDENRITAKSNLLLSRDFNNRWKNSVAQNRSISSIG